MNRAREQAVRKGLEILERSNGGDLNQESSPDLHRVALSQLELDVTVRTKTNKLPWRGQFPPELVGYFLDTICKDSKSIFDPFCGSGTVLFEAMIRGKAASGVEVNPAAWHLAKLASFAGLSMGTKRSILDLLRPIAMANGPATGLFSSSIHINNILQFIRSEETEEPVASCLAALLLLGMRDEVELAHGHLARGAASVLQVLKDVHDITAYGGCNLEDARCTSLEDDSVDGIITSPPYINVFNYHQNYRSAVELLGWRPLDAAPSEIGANRKHRGNRFLTVIQYCLIRPYRFATAAG